MITVTVDNAPVLATLARLQQRMNNLHPAMTAIGQSLQTRIKARRETRRDPTGAPWAPWQPATLKRYPKDGNRRLLDRYGDMFDSVSMSADATSVRVGFAVPYATYHEFGTKKMIRRGLLFANPTTGTLVTPDERLVLDILTKHLNHNP